MLEGCKKTINKMENNKIYEELVQKYKDKAQEFSKEKIGTPEAAGRLENLIELDMLFIKHIEELSPKELTKLRQYRDLTKGIYRYNLELSWSQRF